MDRSLQTELPDSPEKPTGNIDHVDREKKITDPMVARLLRSARRIVEERAWEDGLVWYPNEILRWASSAELARSVFPDLGTTAARVCTQAVRNYIEKPLNENEAREWIAEEIEERLNKFVIGARDKIGEARLVVTERKIKVRAERPDTTRKAVGPAPWTTL
jgi:hypothetical protein